MWLSDIEKASAAIRVIMGNCCIKEVHAVEGGLVFATTHFTYIKWHRADGHLEEWNAQEGGNS